MSSALSDALVTIPASLRDPLISEFELLLSEYRSGRWESVGLKAGKICEIVFSILRCHVDGAFLPQPTKPKNMVAACQQLEQADNRFSRSVRIQIPRLLIAIYELRNNRDIGHVGGEVNPNHMDAELFLRSAKWLVAELVRVFTELKPAACQALVETVTERIFPAVWEGNGMKRVLNRDLPTTDKALLLSYCSLGATARQIAGWLDYGNLSRFRNTILQHLHDNALVHFNPADDTVVILPPGIKKVESNGLLTFSP